MFMFRENVSLEYQHALSGLLAKEGDCHGLPLDTSRLGGSIRIQLRLCAGTIAAKAIHDEGASDGHCT